MALSVKRYIRRFARHLGYDITPFSASSSEFGAIVRMLCTRHVDVVIDVGANSGQFSARLRDAGYPGRIVSFEPIPAIHSKLKIRSAGDSQWIVAPPMAIGETCGEVTLNVSANDGESSSILPMKPSHLEAAPHAAYVDSLRVKCHRLDAVLKEFVGPDQKLFLKIDVQGYELPVLHGAATTLASTRTVGVQLEMSFVPLYDGQALFQEVFNFVNRLGFVPWGFYPAFSDHRTGQMLQCDGLFFR